MSRTLLLDIGGVFYLSTASDSFFARWAERTGLEPTFLRSALWHGPDIEAANVGGIRERDYFHRAGQRMGVSADIVEAMIEDCFRGEFNQPLADFVRAQRANGVAAWSLTNNWLTEQKIKARPHFAGMFDRVISSCDVGLTKPSAEIYHLTLRQLGLAPSDIIFVDDTESCIATGRALGMRTVHFQSNAQAIAEIAALLHA